ncbi:MAG: hypothetical protein OQK12_10650 [Motiliproteus sp.]|nr:hypothetical protein [Motiliproteus sp.]MCW9054235.1 hypothetical protein [Motiliproteus sp.]
MDQPSKSELIKPISGAGLIRLQRDMDAISQEVTNGYFKLHPECYQTRDPVIKSLA